MSIYPSTGDRERLKAIKYHHDIAASIVAEYALEVLFATRTDEEIIAALRARGHGLRRAKAPAQA
jgi:hypothetical protein